MVGPTGDDQSLLRDRTHHRSILWAVSIFLPNLSSLVSKLGRGRPACHAWDSITLQVRYLYTVPNSAKSQVPNLNTEWWLVHVETTRFSCGGHSAKPSSERGQSYCQVSLTRANCIPRGGCRGAYFPSVYTLSTSPYQTTVSWFSHTSLKTPTPALFQYFVI